MWVEMLQQVSKVGSANHKILSWWYHFCDCEIHFIFPKLRSSLGGCYLQIPQSPENS